MSEKRRSEDEIIKPFKRRKAITLEEKYEILSLHESGMKVMDLAFMCQLSHSTISTILKNKQKVLEEVKSAGPMQSTTIRKREGLIPEVEKVLIAWINHHTRTARTPLTQAIISAKALSIFDTLKKQRGETSEAETFSASKGWFDRFRKRAGWHNIKIQGKTAKEFPEKLAEIIEEEGYSSRQIFNVDETGLFWKRMPSRTHIAKEEKSKPGFKVSKDRVTLLLGANAAGDCKLKPLLIYRAETPRALKRIYKRTLPVIWRWNTRAWMTASIFEEWFYKHFVHEVEKYCADNDLPFKILLLLNNAPGHPLILQHAHSNIKIIFFPPNNTSNLQPMYQGVIASFKAYYLRLTFERMMEAVNVEESLTVREFWRQFSILDAIKIIIDAWNEISESHMKGVWKKLCPQFVEDFEGFESSLEKAMTSVVDIANRLALQVSIEDVNELLNSHEKEPTIEELIEIAEQGTIEKCEEEEIAEQEAIVKDEKEEQRTFEEDKELEEPNLTAAFALERLKEAFEKIDSGLKILETDDPNFERSSKVIDVVRNALSCYKKIYRE
ncbi:tigger transposable element-derived protein 1-like, partial [Centruroides sculpturatus]|uniref:tigger transposable element-derived protein 1-like n=1 Tax=Centruroides sculpturatus TaxID=218467 RepID=UPI000C6D649C